MSDKIPENPPNDLIVECPFCGYQDKIYSDDNLKPNDIIECSECDKKMKLSSLIIVKGD